MFDANGKGGLLSKTGVCTLGELEAAVQWMASEFDGDISVIYSRNGKHGYEKFIPDGTVAAGIAVVVTMYKPGFGTRVVGRLRVIEHAKTAEAELQTLGPCPAYRWVILMRLALCSIGQPVVSMD